MARHCREAEQDHQALCCSSLTKLPLCGLVTLFFSQALFRCLVSGDDEKKAWQSQLLSTKVFRKGQVTLKYPRRLLLFKAVHKARVQWICISSLGGNKATRESSQKRSLITPLQIDCKCVNLVCLYCFLQVFGPPLQLYLHYLIEQCLLEPNLQGLCTQQS